MTTERPEHVTLDRLKARLAAVEAIRNRWRQNPDYVKTLDADIYALRFAIEHWEGS